MADKYELNEGLTVQTLLDKVDLLLNGEITNEELDEWGKTLNVRTSIPMMEKMGLLMRLVNSTGYGVAETQEINVCELYKNLFFVLYLGGYLGLTNISKDAITYNNYDKLEPIFGAWIESFAKHDIDLFKDMLRDTVTFYNAVNLDTAMSHVDVGQLDKVKDENAKLMTQLEENKQLVADIKELMEFDNPATKKLLEDLKKSALNVTKNSK